MNKINQKLTIITAFIKKHLLYIIVFIALTAVVIYYGFYKHSANSNQILLNKNQSASSNEIVTTTAKTENQQNHGKIRFSELIETAPVNDIISDYEGGVWVATEKGMCHIVNNSLTNYSYSEGSFPYTQAQSVTFVGKELKVATLFGLCKLNESGRFIKDSISSIIPSQLLWDISYDGNNLWIGSIKGISFITRNDSITTLTSENTMGSLKDNWCKRIKNVANFLVSIHDKGISIWDTSFLASNPNAWKNIEFSKSILNRPINDVTYDGQYLWLATGNGVCKLLTQLHKLTYEKNFKFSTFTKLQGLASDNIRSIVFAKGSIWVGTSEGLAKIKDDQVQMVFPDSGSHNNNIRKIYASDDILWIGTDKGIQYINMATVK